MFMGIGIFALVLVVFGYLFPRSIPGKFVWATLNMLNMAGDDYKAKHSISNYAATVERKSRTIGSGAEKAGDYEALIQSRTREKQTLMDEADTIEAEIDQLDTEGVSDDNPLKVRKGERLMQIQERLGKISEDLSRYGQTQANTIALLQKGKQDVVAGKRKAREMTEDYKASQTELELSRSNASFDPDGGHDTMQEAADLVQQQIDKNRGRAKVFQEVMGDTSEDRDLQGRVAATKTKNFLAQRRAQKEAQANPVTSQS